MRERTADAEPTAGATDAIDIEDLTKVYDPEDENVVAVDDMDLHIGAKEFVALLGPSGCGKSTVMNCIAGYLDPTEGEVLVDGEPVSGPGQVKDVIDVDLEVVTTECFTELRERALSVIREEAQRALE